MKIHVLGVTLKTFIMEISFFCKNSHASNCECFARLRFRKFSGGLKSVQYHVKTTCIQAVDDCVLSFCFLMMFQ